MWGRVERLFFVGSRMARSWFVLDSFEGCSWFWDVFFAAGHIYFYCFINCNKLYFGLFNLITHFLQLVYKHYLHIYNNKIAKLNHYLHYLYFVYLTSLHKYYHRILL